MRPDSSLQRRQQELTLPAVARIALVKPDKARGVENMVLAMAQRGQIQEQARSDGRRRHPRRSLLHSPCQLPAHDRLLQVTDAQLLSMLEKVNEQIAPKATVRLQWGGERPGADNPPRPSTGGGPASTTTTKRWSHFLCLSNVCQ